MLPRLGIRTLVPRWIAVTLGVSLVAFLDGGWTGAWLSLAPQRVWRGELWRLASWVLVAPGPLSLVLTCACIYRLGGELAMRWGDRRLLRFMTEIVVGTAVVTTLVAWLSDTAWYMHHLGGWAVCDALVIAWARQFPGEPLTLYGLVVLSGRNLIAVTIGITCVYALYAGPFAMLPELVACAAAYWYPSARLERMS